MEESTVKEENLKVKVKAEEEEQVKGSSSKNEETKVTRVEKAAPEGKEVPIVNLAEEEEEDVGDKEAVPKKTHYCSMCWGEDTEDKLLFQCRECSVVYHNDCYRGVSTDAKQLEGLKFESNKEGLFVDTCFACASVGKTVRGRTKRGIHHALQVTKRPFECCLCSVDDPSLPLPMQPVFDRNNGRHLILERGETAPKETPLYRLAWCHTLCAQVIGVYAETGGCVYSCLRDGTYGGHAEDDDDRSIGSAIEHARNEPRTESPDEGADPEKTLSLHGIHHFCIVLQPKWKAYIKAINKHKKFSCLECLLTIDVKADDWRMAIPCMCKEAQEPKDFRRCNGDYDDECLRAMHVGCAMWGRRINGKQRFPGVRRVYFEESYGDGDNMGLIYCNEHAKNIRDRGEKHGVVGCDWLRFPGRSGEAAISRKGSKVPNQQVRIENADASIESDRDEDESDDDNYGLIETDDELEGDTESDSSNSDSDAEKRKERKRQKRLEKRKRKKKLAKEKRKRAPKKEETSKDRLAKKLSKRQNSSSGGTGTSSGGQGGNRGIQQSTFSTTQSKKKHSLATVATSSVALDTEDEVKVKGPPPAKKKRKGALKLKGLLTGEKMNWNP